MGDREVGDEPRWEDCNQDGVKSMDIECRLSRSGASIARRMDAIVVGIETALTDDPMLTVRPPGLRVPLRVIIDSRARLPIASRLVQSRNEGLVIVVCGPDAKPESVAALRDSGCEVLQIESNERSARLEGALRNLSGRGCTNVLVEGGGTLLGDFLDHGWIDEVHAFIAPLLLGGADAPSPIAGHGVASVAQGMRLESPCFEWLNGNIYLHGLTSKSADVSLPEST